MVQKKQSKIRVLDRQDDTSISETAEVPRTTKRKVDIGLDISTSNIGYCVLDANTGSFIRMGYVKLTSNKFEDIYDKGLETERAFTRFIEQSNEEVSRIFVEEAHMKFTPGFSSAKTLFALATFNGIICYKAYEYFGSKPIKIGVRTARSKMKIKINFKDKTSSSKEKVFQTVKTMNPSFPWETKVANTGPNKGQTVYTAQNYDMADAYIICRGGQLTTPL